MRVIAGKYKRRQLKIVPGSSTRPTSDKLKESIFNMIGPYFDGGLCLDLFAGSGALGIEALSRGMEKAVFVDYSPTAIKVIKQNIAQLELQEHCEVYRNDAFRALHVLSKKSQRFDLVFLDPPYEKVDYKKLLQLVVEYNIVLDDGLIYVEHQPNEKGIFCPEGFSIVQQKQVSSTTGITIFQKMPS